MGGIGITHRRDSRKVYIEFYNDGRVHALLTSAAQAMQTRPINAERTEYERFIAEAKDYLNG